LIPEGVGRREIRLRLGGDGPPFADAYPQAFEASSVIDAALESLAQAALAAWPDWFEERQIGGKDLLESIVPFDENTIDMLRVIRLSFREEEADHEWLKEAVSQGVFRGQPPYFRDFPAELQARQLGLILMGKYRFLRIFPPQDASPSPWGLKSYARGAEWMATEAGLKVMVILPESLRGSPDLSSILYRPRSLPGPGGRLVLEDSKDPGDPAPAPPGPAPALPAPAPFSPAPAAPDPFLPVTIIAAPGGGPAAGLRPEAGLSPREGAPAPGAQEAEGAEGAAGRGAGGALHAAGSFTAAGSEKLPAPPSRPEVRSAGKGAAPKEGGGQADGSPQAAGSLAAAGGPESSGPPSPEGPKAKPKAGGRFPSFEGRPNPTSLGENILAERIGAEPGLAPLFAFNAPVRSRSGQKFIVDLLWEEGRLVVEIDGYSNHSTRDTFNDDRDRDFELLVSGYRVLRIPHSEALDSPDKALWKIVKTVEFINGTMS
jgi:hypothetical protein